MCTVCRFIFQCDIIQGTPPALRKKAARLVGAKCTLLARMDAYGQVLQCRLVSTGSVTLT